LTKHSTFLESICWQLVRLSSYLNELWLVLISPFNIYEDHMEPE
jgi:hypothetical protein